MSRSSNSSEGAGGAPIQSKAPESPLVSIVVITMNRRDDLKVCLDSLRRQDYSRREIVVVDNCSTDDTREMLAAEYPDVRVEALPTNRGVSGGRNHGAESAQGEICLFIDDDATLPDPGATRRVVEHFRRDEKLACIGFTILDAATGQEELKAIPRRDKRRLKDDYLCTYFCGAGFAVRTRVFLEAGMFWEPLVYGGQELDLSYRLLDRGFRILHSASIVVLHRSTSAARPEGQWVYFNARDRSWVAIRNLPWSCVASTTASWWANTAWTAMRCGQWRAFFRGAWDGILGMPSAMRGRRCVSPQVQRQLVELSGRLRY